MFVVSATAHGIRQPLLAYTQVAGAIAHALIIAATATDRSQIYRVANAEDARDAVAAVGLGNGMFLVGMRPLEAVAVDETAARNNAKAQVITAITNELLSADPKQH